MHKHLPLSAVLLLALTASCISPSPSGKNPETERHPDSPTVEQDTSPRVTGIGGIFFFSDDPAKTREWYARNLGLVTNEYGSTFESRNANRPEEINYLQWSPFRKGNSYFAPSKKEFLINYRVQNLEGLLRKLKGNGVTILDTVETYDYGKFVHILDHEGNKIELWEPVDSVLTSLGSPTTK
ncbi:MAG: VOC family protein [Bacteroidales bacterium]